MSDQDDAHTTDTARQETLEGGFFCGPCKKKAKRGRRSVSNEPIKNDGTKKQGFVAGAEAARLCCWWTVSRSVGRQQRGSPTFINRKPVQLRRYFLGPRPEPFAPQLPRTP